MFAIRSRQIEILAENWKKITSDYAVLDTVQHCHSVKKRC